MIIENWKIRFSRSGVFKIILFNSILWFLIRDWLWKITTTEETVLLITFLSCIAFFVIFMEQTNKVKVCYDGYVIDDIFISFEKPYFEVTYVKVR